MTQIIDIDLTMVNYLSQKDDAYGSLCGLLFAIPIDRTSTLKPPFDFLVEPANQIIDIKTTETFEQICLNRAYDINSKKKPINLLWSGGIDSSAVLCAFIDTGDISNLTVHFTNESLLENEAIYIWAKTKGVVFSKTNFTDFATLIASKITLDEIIVTGELSDQLLAHARLLPFITANTHLDPLDSTWNTLISNVTTNPTIFRTYLQPLMDKCPFQILDVTDLLFWLNFTCKWQSVSRRILSGVICDSTTLDTHMLHFFKTNTFQSWAMNEVNHRTQKLVNGDYKYCYKRYIARICGTEDWIKDKTKHPSLMLCSDKISLYTESTYASYMVDRPKSPSANQNAVLTKQHIDKIATLKV